MTASVSFTDSGRDSWRSALPLGLPEDFDFRNIRTEDDAAAFIMALNNPHRGIAAKRLYEHRHLVGNKVAFRGLLEAWNHDHTWVLLAFGSDIALAAAFREVKPARKRRAPVTGWRGVDNIHASLGLSWTTNRNVACFFAVRSPRKTPLVLRYEFRPEDIVATYNGRCEHELIVDPERIDFDRMAIDDGGKECFEMYAYDIGSHADIPSAVIARWEAGAKRYAAFMKARYDHRLQEARARKHQTA